MWPFNLLFGKRLESVLYATRVVRVHGVRFKIRKVNPVEFLNPKTSVLLQQFATYEAKIPDDEKAQLARFDAAKEHYKAVILAGVVEPVLKSNEKEDAPGIPVEHLFTDWDFATELYEAITNFTYGKKKLDALKLSQKSGA